MIAAVNIDIETRTITCVDENGYVVTNPLTGDIHTNYTKSSPGGLIIQALVKMLERREGRV